MDQPEIVDVVGSTEIVSLSTSYIFQVAILLTRLPLPKDIIPRVLDFAGFYAGQLAIKETQKLSVSDFQSGCTHSAASVPRGIHPKSLRAVVFETVSRDQGWSWDEDYHGTYSGSWTWFEAGILPKQIFGNGNGDGHAHGVVDGVGSNGVVVPLRNSNEIRQVRQAEDVSRKIVTNVHAGKRLRRHRVRWTCDDADPWMQNFFAQLEAGESVGIKVCAMYPAWMNHVASTTITFEYLPVRKVP